MTLRQGSGRRMEPFARHGASIHLKRPMSTVDLNFSSIPSEFFKHLQFLRIPRSDRRIGYPSRINHWRIVARCSTICIDSVRRARDTTALARIPVVFLHLFSSTSATFDPLSRAGTFFVVSRSTLLYLSTVGLARRSARDGHGWIASLLLVLPLPCSSPPGVHGGDASSQRQTKEPTDRRRESKATGIFAWLCEGKGNGRTAPLVISSSQIHVPCLLVTTPRALALPSSSTLESLALEGCFIAPSFPDSNVCYWSFSLRAQQTLSGAINSSRT